jgi:hypothetical protein
MSTAYKRVADLLDRWQASVELHARYLALDDAAYARMQDWPKHQRPTKWVVELARTRLEEMRRQLDARERAGDATFAESLELISLLTNLLGSDHIERFIPLATRKTTAASGTVRRPRLKTPDGKAAPRTAARTAPASPPARTPASARHAGAPQARSSAPPPPDAVIATVIADAVRFLSWGREWPALAPLIARLADRPSEADISRILRANREHIERKARQPAA